MPGKQWLCHPPINANSNRLCAGGSEGWGAWLAACTICSKCLENQKPKCSGYKHTQLATCAHVHTCPEMADSVSLTLTVALTLTLTHVYLGALLTDNSIN